MEFGIIDIIQSMLAPGIMISACGLLILGMNNKYSIVVNRIRLLNEEKRRFASTALEKEFLYNEEIRLKSIATQLTKLRFRVKLVRNAVFCYSLAVGMFVTTSLIIGIAFWLNSVNLESVIIALFSLGMISVLVGIFFAAYESVKGYEIINFEIKADE
ncbi:MAG TPA: DUF2721 domain-containing protein [Ignavibacteriaceae bacterium]|nr:DUF2721 domain-containing protein [Ignavibacteriaceae bacterium]